MTPWLWHDYEMKDMKAAGCSLGWHFHTFSSFLVLANCQGFVQLAWSIPLQRGQFYCSPLALSIWIHFATGAGKVSVLVQWRTAIQLLVRCLEMMVDPFITRQNSWGIGFWGLIQLLIGRSNWHLPAGANKFSVRFRQAYVCILSLIDQFLSI